MKRFLFLFTVIAALMNFTSCSNNDDPAGVDPNQPVEIKVGGRALDVVASTRAPFDGITASNTLTAKVMAANTAAKYTTDQLHDNFMVFGPTDAVGFTVPKAYPHATDNVYLVGMYPSTGWNVATDVNADFTFTGKEDVMVSNEVATVKDDVVNDTQKSLTFHHLLTRLNLTIQAKDADAQTAWGQVKSLKVVSTNDKVMVTLGTGTDAIAPDTVFTGGNKEFDFYNIGADTPYCSASSMQTMPLASASPATQSYALVAPQGDASATQIVYTLKVKTENYDTTEKVVYVPLKVSTGGVNVVGSTAGKMFEVVLTFTATNIEATATVKPWTPGGNGDVDVD